MISFEYSLVGYSIYFSAWLSFIQVKNKGIDLHKAEKVMLSWNIWVSKNTEMLCP